MRKIAVMMRAEYIAESLNNEGTIGNSIQPREITLADGTIRQAISGEMLKHQHTRNLRLLAEDDELCETCKIFSPMKNGKIKQVDESLSKSGNRVKTCIIDDIHGLMNAKEKEKRNSCIKFSWAIATEENEYQNVIHSRVEPLSDAKKAKKNKQNVEDSNENNDTINDSAQMIFYRPIRSNEYAVTIQIDLDRIGFDDEKLIYALSNDEIKNRQKKCLKALTNMFIDMEGAMSSTRLPHIKNIYGVVVDKADKNDVLVKYSALNDDFIDVNKKIGTNVLEFKNIEEFVDVINNFTE